MVPIKRLFILFVFSIGGFNTITGQQWNPDAGLVRPYQAQVTVSSGTHVQYITDGNYATFWQSENPLPSAYIRRTDLNLFLNNKNFSIHPQGDFHQGFDGNTDTKTVVSKGTLEINLRKTTDILRLSIKLNSADTVFITCYRKKERVKSFKIATSRNYQVTGIGSVGVIDRITLHSNSSFDLFEMAALAHNPSEWVLFDFGRPRKVGWIRSRHLNKGVLSIQVIASLDGKKWQHLLNLSPQAVPVLNLPLKHRINARFVKVVFQLSLANYQKATLWEMEIYDRYGPYGKPYHADPSVNTWEETFGVNTIWGWGYSVYSDRLPKGTGPQRFTQVAKLARSYHNISWDINTPSDTVDFDKMKTEGTPAKNWLNWDREYGCWKKNGFSLDATILFNNKNFPDTLWHDSYHQAFRYGKAYASHFVSKKHLIGMIEVGNEPWTYSHKVYASVLEGMSRGIQTVSKAQILPCALQATEKWSANHNYVSDFISRKTAPFLSGLNTHIYPYVFNARGQWIAVNPEDRRSKVWSLINLQRFVQHNMPGKKVYVTEFGYDSNGGDEPCTHPGCVSELEQAIYGVRMAMILWRLGAEKMYWYYFANVDYDSFLHNRSGLTASYQNKFQKKRSFDAFRLLQNKIGGFRFEKVLTENSKSYAYLLLNPKTGKRAVIAWRPTRKNHERWQWVTLPLYQKIKGLVPITGTKIPKTVDISQGLRIQLSGIPVLIWL